MKTRSLLFLLALLAFSGLQAQTRGGAHPATFQRLLNDTDASRIVAVVGMNGQTQPDRWQVLVRNPNSGALKEIIVENNRVLGQRYVPQHAGQDVPTQPLRLQTLQLDTSEIFIIAEDRAIQAGVGFDRVNYQLRWRGSDNEPTWLATLINQNGQVAGQVIVAAKSGRVLHQSFNKNNSRVTTANRKTRLPIATPKTDIWTASKKKAPSR